ncbi:solute carrier family 22 member 23-like [Contarinia nasturtii]|uniref:solute carrier family 22 member 23-like n=1 Tax=Contarinia nasturtii TaxID=265458 RepID=UPI0012D386BB|nr:solute carrier family 22 member 23-like [Contarinia nasturtii]
MDIAAEDILRECGEFEPYQCIMLLMFCIINVLVSIHYFSQTTILFVPDPWCYYDDIVNKSIDQIREIYSNYSNPSCTPYKTDVSSVDFFGANNTNDGACDRWIYEYDHGYKSMSSELNWVCDSAWKSTIGQSMFFVGSVFGTTIFGAMADSIGRLPVLIFSNVMALIDNGPYS